MGRAPRDLKDDRLFRLEIVKWYELEGRAWAVVTLNNVLGHLPARLDYFPTKEDALGYYLKVVVETPRVSLGRHPPDPLPSIERYTAWLRTENIHDPVLNPIEPSD